MTPARIASLVVALVLVVTLTALRAADGVVGALVLALLGAVALLVGAWCAPLTRSPQPGGGSVLKPWRPEYEGPKTTQVVGGGLVAVLAALITSGAPLIGPILGAVAAVFAGMYLRIPSRAEVAAVVGEEELAVEDGIAARTADRGAPHDDGAVPAAADETGPLGDADDADVDPDTAPVPVLGPLPIEDPVPTGTGSTAAARDDGDPADGAGHVSR